jgi:two-component system OmpR family response regulator
METLLMKHIFIVDDDIHIGNMLEEVLQREGYKVSRAYSGTEALLVLSSQTPDLILLDLMLPGLNGEDVLPKIQGIPVIVLSAKSETAHKVQLLLDGACDYITKPFDLTELLARITVQLRNASSQPILRHTLTFQEINLNAETHSVSVQDRPVKLTRTEYAILKLLMENPSQVITKSVLLDRISEDTPDCMESSLKVHISNLRKKLKAITDKDYIEAVWGIGFKMKED